MPTAPKWTQVHDPVYGYAPTWFWITMDLVVTVLLVASAREAFGGAMLVLAVALPVAVRRLWPVPMFAVLLAVAVLIALPFGRFGVAALPLALGIYMAAAARPKHRLVRLAIHATLWITLGAAVVQLAMLFLGVYGPLLVPSGRSPTSLTVSDSVGAALASAGGLALIAAGGLLGNATARRRRAAEQSREQVTQVALAQERLRIARELHDVVAHEMSVITVQAGVARHVAKSRPDEVASALASIENASRVGLRELRQLLSTLRMPGDTGAPAAPSLNPVPGLVDLDSLLVRTGQAGLSVTPQIRGTVRPLPAGLDLSAYRIVQEALTNVVRHAGPARATVLLDYRPNELVIEVTDDGRGAATRDGQHAPADAIAGGGHGLVGMRERVAVYGGRLEVFMAEPPASGFRVRAVLPVNTGSE